MTDVKTLRLIHDGSGLQTRIYSDDPTGPILFATAVNVDVAGYIVHSCNAYPSLVKALSDARRDIGILLDNLDWLTQCTGEGPEGEDAAVIAQIRAALKAVGGET